MSEDVIALQDEPGPPGAQPLLVDVMRGGRRTWREPLEDARRRCRDRMASLPVPLQALDDAAYTVRLSGRLEALRREMAADHAGG